MQASVGSDAEKEGKSHTMSSTTGAEVKQKSSKSSHHESKKTPSQKSSGKKESEGHKKKDSASSSKQLFEPCVFGKSKVWLPQEIIHNPGIFQEVVSMSTWEDTLSDEDRKKLLKLLPIFPENSDDEQKETLKQLFDGVNFRFGNPLRQFEQDLIQGCYGVDSVEKQRAWERLQKEECQKQNSHRLQTMLPEVLIKRQELLEVVQFTSPSEYIRKPPQPIKKSKVDIQSNLKYEKLLEDLSQEMGESFQSDEDSDKTVFTDEEECGSPKPWEDRLHNLFDSPPRKTHCTITPKPSSNELNGTEKSKTKIPDKSNVVTEKDYMRMLERMQIVKEDSIEHPEFIFSHITLRDIVNRTYPMKLKSPEEISSLKRKRKKEKEEVKVKKKKRTPTSSPKPSTPVSLVSSQESAVGLDVPSSPESGTTIQPEVPAAPVKQENAQPAAPVSSEVQSKVQYQVPHSFFALLRKYFNMAMNHQLWVSDLQEKVSIWEKSPVSALCPWRPLQSTWSKVVENTLYFLSMEEQGRLVNYLEEEDAWMWPDPMSVPNDHLTKLFKRWLDLMLRVQPVASPVPSREGTVVIPEPRMYTDYTVKTSLEVDVKKFREQELQRFAEPHKPFTYFQHGYESVVGPVKGITSKDPLPSSKGREHSLLVSDRPSYVTILSLVRDAVARLPNGEGTKIEICQLLRESQYIAPNSEASLLAAVSGALDRLHNEKDPSVKFDSTRKLWVYLHRNRSMRDFERIQMERLIANRSKRSASKQRQAANQSRPQTPFSSGDFPTDLAQSSSESSSPSLESPNRSSPASARSMSPRIPSLSPRSAGLGMDVKGLDLSKNPIALGTTYTVERPPTGTAHGVMKGTPAPERPQVKVAGQGGAFDPNLSTIQSLISESLIKSQLLKKTTPRSKTPPASLGRSNTTVTSGAQLLATGSIQRSLSIPASWPHISCSAAGDLIPSDVLLTGNPVKLQAVKTQPKDTARQSTSASKKGMDASGKARASSPRAGGSDKKSVQGVKSKSKGEKSKNSKSASAEKKSPTVQLKSGAITVTLPSSALKGQTVRSILASAASITIGKTSQGEEQSHPTVQAVRKRLLAEKNQAGIKAKQAKAEVKVPVSVSEKSDSSGPSVPAKIDPKPTSLPTIILRPTAPTFIGQAQPKSKDMAAVSAAQISSQPVALVAPKPAGIITGVAPSPSATPNKQVPLSLVVSGSSSKGTHATTKPVPYLQQGNFPLPSLAPGQNIILQMPDGSKFVTSIPAAASAASSVQAKKQVPVKMVKAGLSSDDSKEKVATSVSVIQPTMGRVLTTQQRRRSLPSPQQQTRPVVTTAATSSNPYDFDDDLEVTKPVIQSFKQSSQPNVVMKSSAGPPNPVLTVTSTASALQGIALNLVTKPSGQTRRQGVAVATTGMVAHRSTVVTTQSPTIKEVPSGGQGTASPKVLVSNQDVPQAMDFTIKSQKLMSSKGNSGEKPQIPSSRVELPASSIIRSKPEATKDQDMKSSKTVLRGSQDVVTSKSATVSGEEKMKVTSAPHGEHHSQTTVKRVTSKIPERPPQQMGRVGATLPPQASFTARGNINIQRNPSNMAGMRVSHRPHSSPGILRKSSQDSSKKHNPGKISLRTTKSVETSSISEQTLKAEVKGDATGSGSRSDQKKPVKGLSKQVIILQKPESFSQSMPSSVSDTSTTKTGVKSLKGASEESSSVVGNSSVFTSDLVRSGTSHELEGSVRTAKLIKSQEKAEAVSGGISKQDGQDQT